MARVECLPGSRLLGLSKVARAVGRIVRPLQVQERPTSQVADWLAGSLRPEDVGVVLEAEHASMSLRGVRANGALTVTSALVGTIREDEPTSAEFLPSWAPGND
jgi:GTP cyclohydrolase I